jgi:hypothetical protein
MAGVLLDVVVGFSTGVVGSLFFRYGYEKYCLSSIFLGTLYWFFYGTAFVIGLLEIVAGELEMGVTRFIAVSVKTFVLCLGAGFGMVVVLENTSDAWLKQDTNCDSSFVAGEPWRIPLFVTRHRSYGTWHTAHTTRHTARSTRHSARMSFSTRHSAHVIQHTSFSTSFSTRHSAHAIFGPSFTSHTICTRHTAHVREVCELCHSARARSVRTVSQRTCEECANYVTAHVLRAGQLMGVETSLARTILPSALPHACL